jgi:hypothetical protein
MRLYLAHLVPELLADVLWCVNDLAHCKGRTLEREAAGEAAPPWLQAPSFARPSTSASLTNWLVWREYKPPKDVLSPQCLPGISMDPKEQLMITNSLYGSSETKAMALTGAIAVMQALIGTESGE